jgi:xylulokinase
LAEYYIGIDSGTQSTKAVVVDGESAKVVGSAIKRYSLIEGLPLGHKDQHPSTWVEALTETVVKSIEKSGIDPGQVKALGVSGQQHGFVPLDDENDVIRPAKLWNDTSTVEECQILIEALGGRDEVIRLIGNSILPGYTASKIIWLKRNEPGNYDRLATVLLPHDYLNFHLTGELSMEYGDASGTALMDVRKRSWSEELVEAIDSHFMDKLPPLHSSAEPSGHLKKEVAESLGLDEGVVVSAGGGDNMMGAIGTGNTKPGIMTVSLGTSGTIYAYSEKPVIDPLGEVAAFCDSTDGWLPLVCTMNVTVATELIRSLFGYNHEELTRAVESTSPGSGGLVLLPYFNGERTPDLPTGTGVYYGLTEETFKAGYLARAAMEGVTMGLNYGLNRLKSLGVEPVELRLTGGGARNKSWRRIAADVFNCEVVTLDEEEGAAYGAALQSMWCYQRELGEDVSIRAITDEFVRVDESSRIEPNQRNVEIYQELQVVQNRLSKDLRESFNVRPVL